MLQFINGSEDAWAVLQQRAHGTCICFNDRDLPPGATPSRARVGFEVKDASGQALLYVDAGGAYDGAHEQVGRWIADGERRFEDFASLVRWVREELGAAYSVGVGSSPVLDPGQVTDLDVLDTDAGRATEGLYLDEDALAEALASRVRGQHEALKTMAALASRHLARRQPRRPAVMVAVGPTGVGKTLSAETLPEAIRQVAGQDMGHGFLRLDMSEYQEAHRVSQLLGAPQGYVGYDDGSQLLDALAANPRQVVLFDEIEKAHPTILRALMNAMDAGRLSSAARGKQGSREVDCRQALFIFTSNIDANRILDDLKDEDTRCDRARRDEVCRRRLRAAGLAPEIVGRIGRFMVFWPLSPEARAEVAVLAVVQLGDEYGLQVTHVAPDIINQVLARGAGESFGARVDRYTVDDLLGPALARAAAAGMSGEVQVAWEGDEPRVMARGPQEHG